MGTSLRKKFRRLMRYVRTGRQEVYLAPFQVQASRCLEGKKVLVTGGGSGIGLAIARKCVACGAQLAVPVKSFSVPVPAMARMKWRQSCGMCANLMPLAPTLTPPCLPQEDGSTSS